MKRQSNLASKSALAAALATATLVLAAPAPSLAQEKAIYTKKFLSLEVAVELAQVAIKHCRSKGYQVAVTVVDTGGNEQVTLRDRFAGPHTPSTALRKAWTAVSFRTNTSDLAKATEKGEAWAVRGVTKALPLGGGVMIREGAGSLIGAVGVSGAPAGSLDDECAKAGIAAIEDKIAF
jgi:uncharacterized protein GlcG (DUF336 family)